MTGAAGFVGQHVLQCLKDAGYGPSEIVLGAQKADDISATNHECAAFDIADAEATAAAIKKIAPTGIVHLAAIAHPGQARANAPAAWRVNFNGVLHLADAVMVHAPSARFVFAGSAEAYGLSFAQCGLPIGEAAPLQPMTVYGATKAAADMALRQMAFDGLDAVCCRAFNQTGPGQPADYVVSAFARQIAMIETGRQARRISVGNLDAARDFLDVRDIARAYVLALELPLPEARDRALKHSSGRARRIGDILEHLIGESGGDNEVVIDPHKLRPNDIKVASGDNRRAKAILGWSPEIAFETTLK
ncbi:MAG: GDP-mannose 4,6-dehydratase, partial [Amphiplicatus sp.]